MASDRKVEDYRRHQLVASGSGSAFLGKAWKDGAVVSDAQGSSLIEVLDSLKKNVDDSLASRARAGEQPSADLHVAAFRRIMSSLSDGHFAMLKAHCRAPNFSITATELAQAAGYAHYSAVNLQYGLVGKMLWEELPSQLDTGPGGEPIYTSALAAPGDRAGPEAHWVWRMRPEVVGALVKLGLNN